MSGAPGASGSAGLFAALKGTGATLIGIVRTRLELVGNEIQLEKLNALRQFALAFAALFCAAFGILLIVLLTTLLLWEQRIIVVAVFAALFLALAAWCYRAVKSSTESGEALFAASLSELQKDLVELKKAVGEKAEKP